MKRGLAYFGLVFGVGFILGTLRVPLIEPRLGSRLAELLEAPVMMAAIYLSARFVTRRFPAARAAALLGSGVLALVLMLSAELAVVVAIRGMGIGEYVSQRDPVAGIVYVLLLLLFALMPWLVGGRRGGS